MANLLCLTIRFLQPYSHGRGTGGDAEWPPSPLRLFQALVAAAAARWNDRLRLAYAVPALSWLEQLSLLLVISCRAVPSQVPYRLYVPDNVGDKVAKSWSGGREASIADSRTEKDVRAAHLMGEAVHYLFALDGREVEFEQHRETISAAARSITHLGWGVDMVVGDATVISESQLPVIQGEVWKPVADQGGVGLRVPIVGTLDALVHKHEAFLNRLSDDGFKPVPPLTTFRVVHFRRSTDTTPKPLIAFSILKPDASGNQAFGTAQRCRDVAAWIRHATGEVCHNWPFGNVASFIHGHHEEDNSRQLSGQHADHRVMFLPLPSIERWDDHVQKVTSIRRVLLTAPPEFKDRIDWLRRRLAGQELIAEEGEVKGILTLLPTNDWVLRQYTEEAYSWSTVTPVILPGYDDRDSTKAEGLLRKAFRQAGYSDELMNHAELEWRHVGFHAGLELAHHYKKPQNLNGPTYHVRVRFNHPVRGPLVVGAGRYRGFGLFAINQS